MTENLCVRCGRPMAEVAYACAGCAYRAGDQLHELGDITPAARDVAHGLTRRGGGGGSGKPGSSLPFDLHATSKLDHVQTRLSTWVGEIAHARGRPIPAPRHLGDDPIVLWSRWLAGHVEWVRHDADAERFLVEVDECVRTIRSVARGPVPQHYLGPCGVILVEFDSSVASTISGPACDGDIYAREGAQHGACRTCGATVGKAERRAWLDAEVRSQAFRASEIEDAYGVPAGTIRVWAARGVLSVHGHDLQGRALYLLSEVLDVAAARAAQRATEQAKRARRAAVKAEEASDAA